MITNNFKFSILNKIFCPVFGSVLRCNLALYASWYGFCSALILLILGIFSSIEDKKLSYKQEKRICFLESILWISFLLICKNWVLDARDKEVWEKNYFKAKSTMKIFFYLIHLNVYLFLIAFLSFYFEIKPKTFLEI
jgi:hypothetical protein